MGLLDTLGKACACEAPILLMRNIAFEHMGKYPRDAFCLLGAEGYNTKNLQSFSNEQWPGPGGRGGSPCEIKTTKHLIVQSWILDV